MTKCNVIRPYIDNERFADLVGGVTSSNACRMHCYGKDNIWNLMSDNTRKDFLIKKLVAAGANIQVSGARSHVILNTLMCFSQKLRFTLVCLTLLCVNFFIPCRF